jgi:hypothetical protein
MCSAVLSERDTATGGLGRNMAADVAPSNNGATATRSTTISSLLSRPVSADINTKPLGTAPGGSNAMGTYDMGPKRTANNWTAPSSTAADRRENVNSNKGGTLDVTPTKQLAKAISALDMRKTSPPKQKETSAAPAARDSDGMALGGVPNDGEDQQALYVMHLNIKQSALLPKADAALGSAANLPLPSVWVSRWVDYSKKYGLGYKLSNGCSGVFFNDATKMLLSTDGDSLCYIERLRRDDGSKYDERKPHRLRYVACSSFFFLVPCPTAL